jgi:hypothetical protein
MKVVTDINAEFTLHLCLHIAAPCHPSGIEGVIWHGSPFWVRFWRSKKEKNRRSRIKTFKVSVIASVNPVAPWPGVSTSQIASTKLAGENTIAVRKI